MAFHHGANLKIPELNILYYGNLQFTKVVHRFLIIFLDSVFWQGQKCCQGQDNHYPEVAIKILLDCSSKKVVNPSANQYLLHRFGRAPAEPRPSIF